MLRDSTVAVAYFPFRKQAMPFLSVDAIIGNIKKVTLCNKILRTIDGSTW